MSDVSAVVVGLILCFLGVGSVHLAVPASGFAIGWMLAVNLGANAGVALLVGLGAGATVWVIVTLILRAALFFVGAITGGVVGAKLFTLLQGDDPGLVLGVIFVLSFAALCGFLAQRLRHRFLLWVCAVGGAGLTLSGFGRVVPAVDDWVRNPDSPTQSAVSALLWIALAITGWRVQRRLFKKKLHLSTDDQR